MTEEGKKGGGGRGGQRRKEVNRFERRTVEGLKAVRSLKSQDREGGQQGGL